MVQKASLFWLCTISLASSALCSRNNSSRLLRRDDVIDKNFEKCRGDTEWENNILARFTGIFFGDFITINSQDILGSLAVQGTFSAPNYVVNANNGANCSDLNSLSSYGLVVGGTVNTFNTQVHGSAYINGGGNIEQIKQQNAGCIVTNKLGTGLFDFDLVQQLLINTSEDFANYPPTLILSNDGTIKELRQNELEYYEIITFHSCEQAICSLYTDLESQIDSIFLGSGNWNGIKSAVNPDKTYVFNIPVKNGNTIIIDTNSPSLGFNPCKVVLNFYPVDNLGFFLPSGTFTLLRKTGSQLGGMTLAPRGHIIDGSTGNFAGNIVGLSYLWENANAGVEIHNYKAAGGSCDMYHGCLPVHVVEPPPPINHEDLIIYPSSTSLSSTNTESTSVVSYTPISVPNRVVVLTSTYSPCPTALETTDTTTDTETDTVTIVEPAKTVMVFLGTVTEVIDTVTEPGTTVTQPAITVTQLAGTLTQLVGTATVASGSTTLTEIQVATETSTATALLTEEHTTTQLQIVTTTAIQIEDTTMTTTQIERVTTTTTAPNSIETTTTTQAGLLETVTIALIKPTTEISGVVTFTSTDTQVFTASVCTETDAIFTTQTTTIGYVGTTSTTTKKSKHYHKGSDKECYEDDEDEQDD